MTEFDDASIQDFFAAEQRRDDRNTQLLPKQLVCEQRFVDELERTGALYIWHPDPEERHKNLQSLMGDEEHVQVRLLREEATIKTAAALMLAREVQTDSTELALQRKIFLARMRIMHYSTEWTDTAANMIGASLDMDVAEDCLIYETELSKFITPDPLKIIIGGAVTLLNERDEYSNKPGSILIAIRPLVKAMMDARSVPSARVNAEGIIAELLSQGLLVHEHATALRNLLATE
jgi:hypothetical protein